MQNAHLISQYIIIGIYIYAAFSHGLIYYRVRSYKVHGVFAAFCLSVMAYSLTNIFALYFSNDLDSYVFTSRLSSVFVILTLILMAWFITEYLQVPRRNLTRTVTLMLLPFFILNLAMEHGILWSAIDNIEKIRGPWGALVNEPVNPVISWPMYGLWLVLVVILFLIVRAVYLSVKTVHSRSDKILLYGLVLIFLGAVNDILIDMQVHVTTVYLSEYFIIGFIVVMSLRLSDEFYRSKLELEALVQKRTQRLQESNRDLEMFSYSISHDLRAPLRAIRGFTEAIQEENEMPENTACADYFRRIIENATRMDAMINGLLQLSQVSRKDLVRRRINLSQLANEIANEYREQDSERTVTVSIEDNLIVYADLVSVRMILANLFDNAWKFTEHTNNASISVRRYDPESNVNGFVFADNGAGFDAKYSDKLFMPFQRLHSAEEYVGLGIGLATVARIVKSHHGEIQVESREGAGVTFYVSLGDRNGPLGTE